VTLGAELKAAADRREWAPAQEFRERRSWKTSHLPRLNAEDLQAVMDVMPAWLHRRAWAPPHAAGRTLLWEFIDRQGLGGALGSLAAAGLVDDEELARPALDRYLSNALHFESAKRTCAQIFNAAGRIGQPVLTLKGPALVSQVYEDTGIRAFSDIDLWTGSRQGLLRLLQALPARIVEDADRKGPIRRMRAPGSIMAAVNQWEIEARYPAARPTDPMLQLLAELGPGHWRAQGDWITVPSPSVHLLILLFHMSWYHYFSRFIWFLDVATLAARLRNEIDLDWVAAKAAQMEAGNALAMVAQFCKSRIDARFPQFPLDRKAWNVRFLSQTLTGSAIASGRFSLHQDRLIGRVWILWLRSNRHFLLSDPSPGHLLHSRALGYLAATIARGLGGLGENLYHALRLLVWLTLYPAARFTGWIEAKSSERKNRDGLQ